MANTENNLDLSKVENTDLEALSNKIEQFYKSDATVKSQLAYNWERNHKFLDGQQWLVYDGSREAGGTWKPLRVSKANEYIPRPTTNYIFDVYQTLKSYLIKNKPRSTVYPNTQLYRDKTAAKIATLCLEANYDRLKEQYNYEYAAACLVTYGTVFKKSYWDSSSLMMAKIPKMNQQPVTDPQTGQVVGMSEVPATDEQGQPVFDFIPLGDVNTDVVEPYRLAIDPLANDLHKARWVMEYCIAPLDWVREVFDKDPNEFPGYTGLISEVEEEKVLPSSMQRFYNLKQSSGVKNTLSSQLDSSGAGQLPENSVVLKEYYERPSQKYPKGRMVVVANAKTLYAGDSPYEGPELGDWHPYSECRWELVPGRFWGASPLDPCVEIQKMINSIDSVIVLTRKTSAIPQKLIPLGSGVPRGEWTGRPGQEVFYRTDPSGAKPEAIPPMGVDQQVFAEREQRLEDLKNISGAIDILKGDRPPGVTAASALNFLYEVGTGKIFPVLDRWKCFTESDQKKQLKLIAKRYKEPRPDFIRLIRAKNQELAPEEISHFIGEDLYDNWNVVVEAGSNIPKLQAAHQAQLQEAAQTGALGLEQPANRVEYQRQMGITGFDNDVGPDMRRASWENDILDDIQYGGSQNQVVVLAVDQHHLHIVVHSNRMKQTDFMSLPAEVQQAYMEHLQQHDMMQQQMVQAQQMEALASGGPEGGPPGQPQQQQAGASAPSAPKSPTSQIKGPTQDQKNALRSDMLTPGAIGQK